MPVTIDTGHPSMGQSGGNTAVPVPLSGDVHDDGGGGPPNAFILMVAVVEPDIPLKAPPGLPTKSMRYVMSKKLSTAHLLGRVGDSRMSVV